MRVDKYYVKLRFFFKKNSYIKHICVKQFVFAQKIINNRYSYKYFKIHKNRRYWEIVLSVKMYYSFVIFNTQF